MKDIIKGILEEYASNEANLHSETLREKLTEDIIKALEHDSRDLSIKDTRQINIFESPDGGDTIYKRPFGDYKNREKV